MKKYFFLVILSILSTPLLLSAQGEFKSGLTLGFNFAQVNGDNMGGYNQAGFLDGIYVKRSISKYYGFQFSFLYSEKGSKIVRNIDQNPQPRNTGIWNQLRVSYLEVPFDLTVKLNEKIEVYGGLGFGYKIRFEYEDLLGFPGTKDDDFMRSVDVQSQVGVEYTINPKWGIALKHSISIRDAGTKHINPNGYPFVHGLYNQVAAIAFDYKFKQGK